MSLVGQLMSSADNRINVSVSYSSVVTVKGASCISCVFKSQID